MNQKNVFIVELIVIKLKLYLKKLEDGVGGDLWIKMVEYIAEVDENDIVLSVRNKDELKENRFRHRICLIIPKTENNKVILSKRAKDKFPFPDVWTCGLGGKVRADESYEEAALREMEEESGFKTNLKLVATSKLDLDQEKAIAKIFTTEKEISLDVFNPDPREIQYFKEFTIEEVEDMIENTPSQLAPTFLRHFLIFKEEFKKLHFTN